MVGMLMAYLERWGQISASPNHDWRT